MTNALSKSALFSGVPIEIIEGLVKGFPRISFQKNDVILQQGQAPKYAYILIEGRVAIHHKAPRGQSTTVLYHYAPYIFGHVEILRDDTLNIGSVTAHSSCQLLRLTRSNYISLLQTNHQVCFNVVRILNSLLLKTSDNQKIRSFGKVEHRLARALWSLARLEGIPHQGGQLVQKKINKSQLARTLGVTRKSIIQGFNKLEREHLVEISAGQCFIPNLKELNARAKFFH